VTRTVARRCLPWLVIAFAASLAACSDDGPCVPTCIGGASIGFALVWSDGTMTATAGLPADVDPVILGSWEPMAGRFTSTGRVGGAGRVLVRADGGRLGTSIPVRVQLEEVIVNPGASTTAPDLFAGPGVTVARAPQADQVAAVPVHHPELARRWWFSSWSPDELRMIVSYEEPTSPTCASAHVRGFSDQGQPTSGRGSERGAVLAPRSGRPLDEHLGVLGAARLPRRAGVLRRRRRVLHR
jgi:hypothetical protein